MFNIDLDSGVYQPYAPLFSEGRIHAISVTPSGDFLVSADDQQGDSHLYELDTATGQLSPLVFPSAPLPRMEAFAWLSGDLVGLSEGRLYDIDLDGATFQFKATLDGSEDTYESAMVSLAGELEPPPYTDQTLSFSFPGNDNTVGGLDQVGAQTYSVKINSREWDDNGFLIADNDRDEGRIVRPIAYGVVEEIDESLGRVVIRHDIDLQLADGTVLDTWYSEYRHMQYITDPSRAVGQIVWSETFLGRVSNVGSDINQLHFAILRHLDSDTVDAAVDIANLLPNARVNNAWWVDGCGGVITQPAASFHWWPLGGAPCD